MKKTKENLKNNNFTKLTRNGISLIVLVITIIVIIILAAAIIISLNNNNPIMEANKARYDSDVANMQAVFTNTVAKVMAKNQAAVSVSAGQINTVTGGVAETTGEVAYTLTDAQNAANATGTIVFDKKDNTDTIFYTGKQLPIYVAGNTIWYVDDEGNISLEVGGTKYGNGEIVKPPFAETVLENVSAYYGKKVTNYETGNTAIDSKVEWQIFYADKNNIYLIADDYITEDICPPSKNNIPITSKGGAALYASYYMVSEYSGSEEIVDSDKKALNSKYFKYLEDNNTVSTNYNMRALAYMFDNRENVWGTYVGPNAKFAIAGPTLEMLLESYNQLNNANYMCQVNHINGYEISTDGGRTWEEQPYHNILTGNNELYINSDSLYYVEGMFIASPAKYMSSFIYTTSTWDPGFRPLYHDYDFEGSGTMGFRPVVCLKSDVVLKESNGNYIIE